MEGDGERLRRGAAEKKTALTRRREKKGGATKEKRLKKTKRGNRQKRNRHGSCWPEEKELGRAEKAQHPQRGDGGQGGYEV